MFEEAPAMIIKGLLFDFNGTLIDILTNEGEDTPYRITANFLAFHNVKISPFLLKEEYFRYNKEQRRKSREEHPEFDVKKIFYEIIYAHTVKEEPEQLASLPEAAARVFRSAMTYQLKLYEGVRDVLDLLKGQYKMGAVSDGQSLWAQPEMRACGLEGYFSPVIVSGDYGFRKPDKRLFTIALEKMGLAPEETIYIGNDMYRDVFGAAACGMQTIFFKSNQGDHSFHGKEPDYIIYDFRQLPEAIRFLESKPLSPHPEQMT